MNSKNLRWLFLLTALVPLFAWDRFMVPAGTKTSDIMISHYPDLLFIQRALISGQGIPLWSPLILSGYPISANPLSSLWYPPAWLSLLFPLPLGINIVMALHILFGIFGFYLLLRKLRLSDGICILGGVLFGLLPSGFTHTAAGHFTWVCASAWLPWLLYISLNFSDKIWKRVGLQAVCLGMMLLADMRFAAYAGFFWLMVSVYIWWVQDRKISRKFIGSLLTVLVLAMGTGAAVWLPLMEYTSLATRISMTVTDTLYLSLPAVQLTGLVVPGHPSSMEWIFYPGAACLLLGLISFSLLKKRKDLAFWLAIGLIFLLWAMGDTLPVNRMLAQLPGISLLRVPSRGLFFFCMALLVAAMITLDELLKNNPEKAVYLRLSTIFFSALVIFLQVAIFSVKPDKNGFILWHSACWLIITASIIAYSYRKLAGRVFLLILSFFAVSDFLISDIRLVDFVSTQESLELGKPAADYLTEKGGDFRVYSPSYSIPQQTAGFEDLELADGIDPLQLKTYSDFVRKASGLPLDGYSVTLPPFKTGDPAVDNARINPDAQSFGLLNVRYMVSAFQISSSGWVLTNDASGVYIYENKYVRGWAWVELPGNGEIIPGLVNQVTRKPGSIRVEAEGPGSLVLSEVAYPGWQVRVDGQPADMLTAHSILRSVDLPAGTHTVEFLFFPERVFIGLVISLISLIVGGILIKGWNVHGK